MAGLSAGRGLAALLCVLSVYPLRAAAAPQRLSPAGEQELLRVVSGGRLAALQQPGFGEYRSGIAEFYRAGGYALAWVRDSRPTGTARAVIELLRAAENEGLPARDYDGPLWAGRLEELDSSAQAPGESELIGFDLALTVCAMRYMLDLHLGRINPRPSDPVVEAGRELSDPAAFLREKVVPAGNVAAALAALEPQFPAYRRLVAAVQRYRELAAQDDGEVLPALPAPVRPGHYYDGVPRLRRLLVLLGDLSPGDAQGAQAYSGALVEAVRRFQARHGLAPDGILGELTLRQLNTPLDARLRQLRLTLERWRWLPHTFRRPPIRVNIPEFRLYAGDQLAQSVVVGMSFEYQTPVFASLLSEVVFRPPWNVPLSIQFRELVPALEKDPSYLSRHGYEVTNGGDVVVSSGPVTADVLQKLRDGLLHLRQRPGPGNALGLVKFHMRNSHSVYLHGTPSTRGFRESRRDLSHGCIRVEDPAALAAWVLRDQPEWTGETLRAAMEGSETVTVKLAEPVPVLIQYGTSAVTEAGEVRFFEDIYGRDAAEAEAFERRGRLAAE
jgi:murein L,D-transpeptidase YcbB/YkuD